MMNVLLIFLFFNANHDLVNAQIAGAGPNVAACESQAAEITAKGAEDLAEGITSYPLCIDTGQLPNHEIKPTKDQKTAATQL